MFPTRRKKPPPLCGLTSSRLLVEIKLAPKDITGGGAGSVGGVDEAAVSHPISEQKLSAELQPICVGDGSSL